MRPLSRWVVGIAAVAIAIAVVVAAARGRPIPSAPPYAWAAPPPVERRLSVCWIEFASQRTLASFSRAGWSRRASWSVTVSGILVRHPAGHLLLDTGNSSRFDDEIAELRWWPRQLMRMGPGSNKVLARAPEALRAAGEPSDRLQAILISHLHPDHAGGLVDLPGAPVLLAGEELEFARRFIDAKGVEVVPATGREVRARGRAIPFAKRPYEVFDESFDLFGDGSVVIVPLPGHTPGSIGTFVNLSSTRRLFHVGDAANTTEAIEVRARKSLAMSWTDFDSDAANAMVSRLAQLHERDPGLAILPAHDRVAWEGFFGGAPGCTDH